MPEFGASYGSGGIGALVHPLIGERLLEAGRLMQAELERLGITEEELSADFKAWRHRRHQP